MKIVPAIDLIDGENVRLKQGDYDQKSLMKRSPEDTIKFYSQYDQVVRVHVVDLIGAKEQEAMETSMVEKLKEATDLPLEIGGGLRDMATIDRYAQMGVDYFILGTKAIMDVPFLKEASQKYPGRIFVGIDAKEEEIYIDGWTKPSGRFIEEYVAEIEDLDLAGIIYTDIAKDGMEAGPNVERTGAIQAMTRHKVVASGGVRHQEDLINLEEAGITEAIVGKAAHEESFWEGLK